MKYLGQQDNYHFVAARNKVYGVTRNEHMDDVLGGSDGYYIFSIDLDATPIPDEARKQIILTAWPMVDADP